MRDRRYVVPIAVALMVAMAGPAAAHKLKIFALTDGPVIRGYVYIVGGRRVAGAAVTVSDASGRPLAEIQTGGDGGFAFEPTHRVDHHFVANLGDGHRAAFVVPARELPPSLPDPSGSATGSSSMSVAATPESRPAPKNPTDASLESLVDAAVARHVNPLREQIAAYEDRIRWHDVLGGLGYILGLTGIAFYVLARRRD